MKRNRLLHMVKLFSLIAALTFVLQFAAAQKKEIVWSAEEKPLADQIHGLRALPDDVRAGTTKDLALKIRKLPSICNRRYHAPPGGPVPAIASKCLATAPQS